MNILLCKPLVLLTGLGTALTLPASADRLTIELDSSYALSHFEEFDWFGGAEDFTAGVNFADFDGDGDLDLAVINGRHWPQADELMLNNGRGQFPQSRDIGDWRTTGYGGCPADVDGDGDMDLLITRDRLPVALFLNDGTGALSEAGEIGEPGAARSCFTADITQNGFPDLVIADRGGRSFIALGPLAEPDPSLIPIFDGRAVGVSGGDLNNDGEIDLVFALRGEATLAVLLSEGDAYAEPVYLGNDEQESRSVALADWDGDGDLDLVTAVLSGPNLVYLNDGGTFEETLEIGPAEEISAAVRMADFNGDGRLDAVFGNETANSLILNLEAGPQRIELPGSSDTYDLEVGDLNGDGLPDVAFANSDAENTLFFGKKIAD